MNRRTVLQSAGVLATVGLAGCLDGVQDHFDFQGVVPIEIENEADRPYNLHLEAREPETGRELYDESFSVSPQGRTSPQHLDRTDQRFRIIQFDDENEPLEVAEVQISDQTELVVITVSDEGLDVDVQGNEIEDETETDAENESTTDTEPAVTED